MNIHRSLEPIWIISFNHSLKGSLKEKAFFCITFPHHIKKLRGNFNESEELALQFLEQISASFKKIADIYLNQATEEEKDEINNIREQFKSLDFWIEGIQKWQDELQNPESNEENPS